MSKAAVRMSVRAVVETTLHESDLVPAGASMERMQQGAKAHRARQGSASETDYRSEVALHADYEGEALTLHVTGRADGIFTDADGATVIEEIKLGGEGQALIPAHRAQAAMYGHMLCQREGLEGVRLKVLYVDARGHALAAFEEAQDADSLRAEFERLCAPAAAWEARKLLRRARRDETLAALPFPYDSYRAGQRKFAQNVYVALRDRKRLFAQAPTGIGKTMAALYPALRAIGAGFCARAVFLTARNTGRRSAMDAFARLHAAGADAMAVEITAKDKVCMKQTRDCAGCACAEGFYDRLPAALHKALGMHRLGREEIAALAGEHALCPFELSLALSELADVIVCDYNYVFDPFVAMDALLYAPGGACLLVDEAHQLEARVQDAHSAQLDMDTLTQLRREAGKALGRKAALYRALTKAIHALRDCARKEDFLQLREPPKALSEAMRGVRESAGEALSQGAAKYAVDSLSLASAYLFAAERFDERYALLSEGSDKHAKLSLCLLHAAKEIIETTRRARGTVYFSATLAPFDARGKSLGCEAGDANLLLPSPFDPAQLRVRVEPVDIRYANREQTAPQVAQAIAAHLEENPGNAIAFFPSYAYMRRIAELLMGRDDSLGDTLLVERRGMREDEKNAVLAAFEEDKERVILLAVLGGAFSEGIDLPGDRLRSVAVVSTGLPQPDARVKAMQAYYDAIGEDGFYLAMTLPGMTRVIQAAGRLIRTHSDTGTLLLIDRRFAQRGVRALFRGTLVGDALGV